MCTVIHFIPIPLSVGLYKISPLAADLPTYLHVFCVGVIYPIVVHWCWTPEGWLNTIGFEDFSGGMIIHGLSGTVCLVATIIMGPRKGRFNNGRKNEIGGHSTAVNIKFIIIIRVCNLCCRLYIFTVS